MPHGINGAVSRGRPVQGRRRSCAATGLRGFSFTLFYLSYIFLVRIFTDTFVYSQAWHFITHGTDAQFKRISADPEFLAPVLISAALSVVGGVRECMVLHQNLRLRAAHTHHHHGWWEVPIIAGPPAVFVVGASLLWQRLLYDTYQVGAAHWGGRLISSIPQVVLAALGAYGFHMRAYEATRSDEDGSFLSHYNPCAHKPSRLYYTWTILLAHLLSGGGAVYFLSVLLTQSIDPSALFSFVWWAAAGIGMGVLALANGLVEGNTEALSLSKVKFDRDPLEGKYVGNVFTASVDNVAGVNHSMANAVILPALLGSTLNKLLHYLPGAEMGWAAIAVRAFLFFLQAVPIIWANAQGFSYSIRYALYFRTDAEKVYEGEQRFLVSNSTAFDASRAVNLGDPVGNESDARPRTCGCFNC